MKPDANPGLPRDFVIKSILRVLETAEVEKRWGSVSVLFLLPKNGQERSHGENH